MDHARQYSGEVLVIDGHSTDDTRVVAERHGAKVLLDGGRGKGDGVRLGIQTATGDMLVLVDGDGSCELADIPKLVAPIREGQADLVIGSRMRGGSEEPHDTLTDLLKMVGNAFVTMLINYRFGTHLTDAPNGFRALRTEAVRSLTLRERGSVVELELVLAALRAGWRVSEVPTREFRRRYGSSALLLPRDLFRLLVCVVRGLTLPRRRWSVRLQDRS